MARMMGKAHAIWARIKLPNGGMVGGLEVKPRRTRRIIRAREKAALRRSSRAEQ